MTENTDQSKFDEGIRILKAGMDRFYTEGALKWTPEAVSGSMHHAITLDDPRFVAILKQWENEGYIKYVNSEDCLFEILKPFPPSLPYSEWYKDKK